MIKPYRWVILLVIIIAAAGLWWLGTFSGLKNKVAKLKPHVEVAAVSITDLGEERIKFTSKIMMVNPLPVEISTRKLDYEVLINDVRVIQNSFTKPFRVGATDRETIEIPMEILAEPMKRILKNFEERKTDSADYTLKMNFEVDIPVAGERIFHMELTRRLPAIRIPTGKLEKFQIHKLGVKESSIDITLAIENPNLFPLKLKDGRYHLTIDNDLEMEGSMKDVIDIPAKGKAPLPMFVTITTAKVPSLVWKALFEKKNTHFIITFNGKVMDAKNKIMQNSRIALRVTGTLDELKKDKE